MFRVSGESKDRLKRRIRVHVVFGFGGVRFRVRF